MPVECALQELAMVILSLYARGTGTKVTGAVTHMR